MNSANPAAYASAPRAERYVALLEELKACIEGLVAENAGLGGVRGEWGRKVEEQVSELNAMEQALIELDRKHQIMKEQYEVEIARLKALVPGGAARAPEAAAPHLPAYPGAFTSRGVPPPPFAPRMNASQPAPSAPQPLPPAPQQQGQPARLMGISSLPSAQPQGASIPAMAPGSVQPPSRAQPGLPGKMQQHPMSNHINGAAPSQPGADGAQGVHSMMKKEPGMPVGPGPQGPGMGAPVGGPGAFPGQVVRQIQGGPIPTAPPGTIPGQTQQQGAEDDWVVFQGRSANGSVVNMNVSLQNSFSHDSVVCCVRYSWDGQYLATGSNRSAHIFDAATGQSVATFSRENNSEMDDGTGGVDSYVRAVCFSPDGNWLITGAEDHVVKVWDVRNRKVKHRLVGHDTDIYSVDASANSQFIVSGSGDKKAKLWSLESGKLLSTLGGEYGPTDGITSVSMSPTSQHVAAGSLDKIVRVWDVDSSRLVRQFEGHRDSVYSVAFSPDGRMLLSGSLDKTLKLWDLAASQPSSQCRLSFTGHKDFVLSVAFSPSGRWLISGSKDRTVQFWDPRQSTMCLMLQGHKNSVISIAHNPTGKSIATGSGDCRARTWMYT